MSEIRRTTSIAKRINRSWLRRMIMTFFLIDAVIVALVVGGWCYLAEQQNGGSGDGFRELSWDETAPLIGRSETLVYTFDNLAGERIVVTGEKFFRPIWKAFYPLLAGEGFVLMIQYIGGKKRAKRLLSPLDRMAQTAQELSRQKFDPDRLHQFEDAVHSLSPLSPDEKLSTGDRELTGLETAINDLLERTRDAYREQSRFVSDASHELRTPVAVIQGYADMLDRWGKNDEKVLSEGITAIKSESEHMKKLIEQLLFLARGDSGRNQMVLEKVDLDEMIAEVCEESRMIHPNRRWRAVVGEHPYVYGDAAMLKQTARILVENAVKFTSDGDNVTLRAHIQNDFSCFDVQDNGVGIAQDDLPHIFDRFFRADPARARQTGGTGLGLSIAKWIVEKHRGHFDVLSREGIGTRITVCLPPWSDQSAAPEEASKPR